MSKMAKMACTEYVSLFQAVFERPVRSVDTPQSAVFLFWASLALFGVLSTLCTQVRPKYGKIITAEAGRGRRVAKWDRP
jgi:hypothetical protein